MYEQYYGLREKPFSLLPDPGYLYLSDKHHMALSLLEYSLMNQAGFCVISGETGAGKTTLIRRVLGQLGDGVTVGLISNTHRRFGELLRWILMSFNLDHTHKDKVQLYQTFIDFLIAQYAANRNTVLIVDEAQNMSPDTLEELRMLSNVNADKDQVIQVILVGQPGLRRTLQRKDLEQFAQRIAVDYHIEPLDQAETRAYIRHRLQVAGGDGALFSDEACDRIFHFSGGIPRLINLIADTALVYGYAEQTPVISARLVDDVVREREKQGVLPKFPAMTADAAPVSSRPGEANRPSASADAVARTSSPDESRTPPRRLPSGDRPVSEPQRGDPRDVEEKPYVQVVAANAGRAGASATLKERTVASADGDGARAIRGQVAAGVSGIDTGAATGGIDYAKRGGTVHAIHRTDTRVVEPSASEGHDLKESGATQAMPPAVAMAESAPSSGPRVDRRSEPAPPPAATAPVDDARAVDAARPVRDDTQRDVVAAMVQEKPVKKSASPPDRRWIWSALGFAGGIMMTAVLIVVMVFAGFGTPGKPIGGPVPPVHSVSPAPAVESPAGTATAPAAPPQGARVSVLERERDAALAEIRALERERDAAMMAAKARQRAEAAEVEATRARERERAAALEAAKALERVRAAELAAQEARERERAAVLDAAKVMDRPRAVEVKPSVVERPSTVLEPISAPAVAEPVEAPAARAKTETPKSAAERGALQFSANPCKGPSAKFLSTCKE